MSSHSHARPVLSMLKRNVNSISKNKSCQLNFFNSNEQNFKLAYATYEATQSYSEINPEPTPLIVLHGFMSSKNNWNTYCKKIQHLHNCKVIALDARNHGESPHSKSHSYDNLVMDLKRFVDEQHLKTIQLLGHSMGGRTAMLFALKYPEKVEKLIVADASPVSTSSTLIHLPRLLIALDKLRIPETLSLSQARKMMIESLLNVTKSRGVITFLMTNLIQKSDGIYGWRFNIKALLNNFDEIASFPIVHNLTYNGPVLFVGGAKSDHIQKSDHHKLLQLFPKAELTFIDGAGHWLHSEKPEEFLKITSKFLKKEYIDLNKNSGEEQDI